MVAPVVLNETGSSLVLLMVTLTNACFGVDELGVDLQIRNQVREVGFVVADRAALGSRRRIDRATVGRNVGGEVRVRFASRRLFGERRDFKVVSTGRKCSSAKHQASRLRTLDQAVECSRRFE